jgi:hypothetical protein
MEMSLKKIPLLLVISAFVITPPVMAKNQPHQKKSQIIIKKVEKKKDEDPFDFRKAKWGMNIQQVHESEGKQAISENNEKLVYPDTLLDLNAEVSYFFEKNRLVKAIYQLEGNNTNDPVENINNFKKIRNALSQKYGRPDFDTSGELDMFEKDTYKNLGELIARGAQVLETRWETPRTRIKLLLKGRDIFSKVTLDLGYFAKDQETRAISAEEEKNKF